MTQRIVFEAEAYGEEVVQKARGETDRFNKMAEQLGNHRELTFKRLILETMEEVLPRLKKIILDGKAGEAIDLGLIEANE